jgi:tRNA-specific 2-thiouridylase
MLKPDVLAFLGRMGLPGGERGESQDVCFVPDGDHGRWIDLRALNTPPPGEIVTTDGRVIGRHDGIHHYTVGQRKGLGIATGRPMYVVRISPEANRVVVGPVEEARQDRIRAEDVSWISRTPPSREFDASVQIRYRHAPAAARVTICAGGAAEIEFREPQFGVAPGQSAAIFKDDEVLGAGWIAGN